MPTGEDATLVVEEGQSADGRDRSREGGRPLDDPEGESTYPQPPDGPQDTDRGDGEVPEAAEIDANGSSPWRSSVRFGLLMWLSCLLSYLIASWLSRLPYSTDPNAAIGVRAFFRGWYRWDTEWYVTIAEHGYHYKPFSPAFFPLYPMLARTVGYVVPGGAMIGAFVVSILACLAALIVVHRLTAEIVGESVARRTVLYVLAFPTGFFLVAGYNESLFIALAVGSLYCMRHGRWWWAGALAGLSTATRLGGVMLGAAFVYEYLRQRGFSPRRIRLDALAVCLVPSGLMVYAWYCWKAFGHPLYFQQAQANWGRSEASAPWMTVVDVVRVIDRSSVFGFEAINNTVNLATALSVIALLVLAVFGRWRLGNSQVYLVVFAGLSIVTPLMFPIHATTPIMSTWRYALECIPAFIVLAKIGENHNVDRLYLVTALPAQGIMLFTFLQYQFVA